MKPQLSLFITLLMIFSQCGGREEKGEEASTIEPIASSTEPKFDPSDMGAEAEEGGIVCYGQIQAPPRNLVTVHPYFRAVLKNFTALEGMEVRKNTTLGVLEHPSLINLQRDYLESFHQLELLRLEYERAEKLYHEQAISQADFLRAKSAYFIEKGHFEGFEKTLNLYGLDPKAVREKGIQSSVALKAPVEGTILKVFGNEGMMVNPDSAILSMMAHGHMHLELQVYPRQLGKLSIGDSISFSIEGEAHPRVGEIFLIGKQVDPLTNRIQVHAHLVPEDQDLALGQYVKASIFPKKKPG